MIDSIAEFERRAFHRISERTTPTRAVPRRPRRTRVAATLRRMADRIDL